MPPAVLFPPFPFQRLNHVLLDLTHPFSPPRFAGDRQTRSCCKEADAGEAVVEEGSTSEPPCTAPGTPPPAQPSPVIPPPAGEPGPPLPFFFSAGPSRPLFFLASRTRVHEGDDDFVPPDPDRGGCMAHAATSAHARGAQPLAPLLFSFIFFFLQTPPGFSPGPAQFCTPERPRRFPPISSF
jgi:hypothetical protein